MVSLLEMFEPWGLPTQISKGCAWATGGEPGVLPYLGKMKIRRRIERVERPRSKNVASLAGSIRCPYLQTFDRV